MEKRRIGEDFKYVWGINWNGVPEDFSDATEIVLTASVYGKKTILERGIDYVIEGNLIIVDFTPRFATVAGIYNLELKYIKPSDGFIDGERRSTVDIDVVQIVSKSSQVTATGDITSTSEAMTGFQGLSAYDGRVAQVESDIDQLAGNVRLLDAIQSAKIKDIESIISTMNPNQSAQLSVSGVSPLSLPKNAANGGMSVKLEGLTEDVGGVITNFVPTGRVRSVDKNGLNPTALYLTAPELRSNGTVKDEIRKGANGYEMVKRISEVDGTVLTTPEIIPISYGGVLNSASNGTVYHEPMIADAGVYETKMDILLTDYPIASIEEIIKHENGIDTYLNVASAVVASDGLSFTHPDLADGDLVLFTYAYDKETTNGNITATFYDSNVVKIDTVTGKAYRINEVVTNGVLTRTLTEV